MATRFLKSTMLVSLLLLSIFGNFIDYDESLERNHELLIHTTMKNSVNESNESYYEEYWKFRQLPNVSVSSGPSDPIAVMDAVVLDDQGIYFLLGQYGTGDGRYSGSWMLHFGSINLNVRDFIGNDDISDIVLLAKLDLNGQWEWVQFLNKNSDRETSLIKWSDDKLAVSGYGVWQDNSSSYDFIILSNQGDVLDSFKLLGNNHPDVNNGYITSIGNKHYFSESITLSDEGKHGLDLCFEESTNSNFLSVLYSIDSEMNVELIFSTPAGLENLYFHNEIFTFHLTYSSQSDKIYYDEGCDGSDEYTMMKTSSQSDISISNFTGAQGNPNNRQPVYVATYDPYYEQFEPIALMSHGCVIHDAINVQKFEKNECIIDTNRNGWASYHTMYSLLDNNWKWGEELITLIDLDYTAAFDEQRNNSPYSGSTVILNLDDLQNTTVNFISSNYTFNKGLDYTTSNPTIASFYHSVHGVSFDYNDAKDGTNYVESNLDFLNNENFAPFDSIPYNSGNYKIQDWDFYCDCETHNFSSNNGFFMTFGHPGWDIKPQSTTSSVNGVVTSNVNNDYHGKEGDFISILKTWWGKSIVPYIYNADLDIQGVPQGDSDSLAFFLTKGKIADILKPFAEIRDIDGTVSVFEESDDFETNTPDDTEDNVQSECVLNVLYESSISRTCTLPLEDLDWDGEINSEDNDKDGDGYPDDLEYFNSMSSPSDPNSGDFSVMENPDLDIIHSIHITTTETGFSMNVDYKLDYSMTMLHFALITQTDEDGNQVDPMDIDYNVNSQSEKDRFEQQLCSQPYPNSPEISIDNWLSGYSHNVNFDAISWSCEWENRRSIDYMEFMMMQASPDVDEIYTNREVLRYSADFTVPSSGSYTLNIPMYLPEMMENEYDQMNWKMIVDDSSPVIFYPTNESAQVTFSVTIPTGTTDTGQGNGNNQQSGNQISPTDLSGWALIIDVEEGSFDCTGINGLSQWDRTNLNGYQEFSLNDGGVSIMCIANFESLSNPDPSACLYLFKDGNQVEKDCDTSMFASVSVDGVEQQLDDLERDLDNLNNDLDNFNNDIDNSLDEIDDSIDEFIDFMIAGLILGAPIYLIFVLVKKRKEKQEEQEIENGYDSFVNSFESPIESKPVPHIEETNSISEPLEPETNHNYRVPPFSFQGEINDDGWEICEYPVSSGTWWWKDYETENWVLWE